MRKTLLFDFDGTLFDSLPAVGGAITEMLRLRGREGYTLEDMRKCIGPPLEYSFSTFFGVPDGEIHECIDIYRRYHAEMLDRYVAYNGVHDALRELKAKGYTLVIATSKWETNAAQIAERNGMIDDLDLIAGSVDGLRSGKREVVQYIIDTLHLCPEDAIMVGDRLYDVEGAAAFGIPTLGVLWGFGSRKELSDAGAIGCVETPEEMVTFIEKFSAGT